MSSMPLAASKKAIQAASEAALRLISSGQGFESLAVDWCSHKVEGYDPPMFEGNRQTGSFLTADYWEHVHYSMQETWSAFIEVRSIFQSQQQVVRALRLATSHPAKLHFGYRSDHCLSYFEGAYHFGILVAQFMPDCGSTNGGFWEHYDGAGLPFTEEGVKKRCPVLLKNYVTWYGIPPNLRELSEQVVSPWLEIAKEGQRATGELLPSLYRVYGDPANEAAALQRLSRLSPSVRSAIRAFKSGATIDEVCERCGISAENARTIRSRYTELISDS